MSDSGPVDPYALAGDRESLADAARRTLPALLVGGISYLLAMVTTVIILNDVVSQTRSGLLDADAEQVELGSAASTANALSYLAQLGILAAGVVYLVWFYKACRFSEHLGQPGRRSTNWAVASWIIPIINFWFPYQAMKDLVPGRDDLLPLLRRWWGLWIATNLSSVAIVLGAAVHASVAWAAAVVAAGVTIGATVSAQQVVTAVDESQAARLDQLRTGR
jgi:hypothetical protein